MTDEQQPAGWAAPGEEPQRPQPGVQDWATPTATPMNPGVPAPATGWGAPPTAPPGYGPPPSDAPGYAPGYAPPGVPGYAAPPAGAYAPPAAAPSVTYRSWQPGIVALRPLPFGDFLTVPFRAMRYARAAVVGAPMLLSVLAALAVAASVWVVATDPGLKGLFDYYGDSTFDPRPETIAVVVVAVIVAILSDTVASAVVIPAVAQAALGNKLSLGDALRAAVQRLGALIGLGAIALLAWVLIGGIVLAPVLSAAFGGGGLSGAFGFTAFLAFVLGIPAGLVGSVYLPVARGVIMLERKGPFRALRRAISLVPGRFWWTVLILIVVGAISGAVSQVLGFGTQVIMAIVSAVGPGTVTSAAVTLSVLYGTQLLVSALVQYSFAGSAFALVYLDLRFRKEGLAFDMARTAESAHAQRTSMGA